MTMISTATGTIGVLMARAIKRFFRPVVNGIIRSIPPTQCYALANRFAERLPPNQYYSVAYRIAERLSAEQSEYLLDKVAYVQRRHLCRELKQKTKGIVQDGVFKGMKLPESFCWGDGDYVPKLLGFYESELQDIIRASIANNYDHVINIGCAEGYYSVGFALLCKTARVVAFDSSEEARRHCRQAAEENGVSERLCIRGRAEPEDVQRMLSLANKPLVIMDCEGGELQLMDHTLIPALSNADFIVECHNFICPNVAEIIIERFHRTHKISRIREGQRDPNRSSFLRHRTSNVRWIAVSEWRPETMEWLCGTSFPEFRAD
jgi:hypothetical protein